MAAPAQQDQPSAQVIGQAFANQYYTVLLQSPELVCRFYKDNSKLGRPQGSSSMELTTGLEAIDAKVQSYGTLKPEIISIDAQESYNGGVIVLITGYMVEEDGKRRAFTQTFFLAPQETGYFVLNDILRHVEDGHLQRESEELANGVAALSTSDWEPSTVQQNEVVNQPEEVNGGEVYDPSEDGEGSVVEQEEVEPVAEVVNVEPVAEVVSVEPAAVVVNEVPSEPAPVVEPDAKTEEAPKKTYASILTAMRQGAAVKPAPASVKPAPASVRPAPRVQHQQVNAAPPAPSVTANTISSSSAVEDGINHEEEVEGPSVYVKNLPVNATPDMLEEAFKKFGPVKSGGIQVRSSKGFCFGFVEFEGADAAQNAIEAASIEIGGRHVGIEEKKSTSSRAGGRGRYPPIRGGFRGDGPRGRGGGGYGRGRGYGGRGESGRGDYGNRGNGRGYQARHNDGYQKGETGNGGPRINRAA